MKKIVLFCIIYLMTMPVFSQHYQSYKPQYKGFQYKIYPGNEEWKHTNYKTDRHELLQLPADTLQQISTERLLETCLYYPMMIEIFSNDNIAEGFNIVRQKFNGFAELYIRSDAATEIIKMYKNRNPKAILDIETSYDRGKYSLDYVILELMMLQDEFVKQLDEIDSKELVKSIVDKLQLQSELRQYYSNVFVSISILAISKILNNNDAITVENDDIIKQAKIFINE